MRGEAAAVPSASDAPSGNGDKREQSASNAPVENNKSRSVGGFFVHVGASILRALEAVGETVADVLGLDEPKFQYVVDSMTEQELEEARKVHELRNAEYENCSANDSANAMECGASGSPTETQAIGPKSSSSWIPPPAPVVSAAAEEHSKETHPAATAPDAVAPSPSSTNDHVTTTENEITYTRVNDASSVLRLDGTEHHAVEGSATVIATPPPPPGSVQESSSAAEIYAPGVN